VRKKIEKISHTIKFSVISKSFPTTVAILVNGDRVFVKDFPAGKKVIEKVVFEKTMRIKKKITLYSSGNPWEAKRTEKKIYVLTK